MSNERQEGVSGFQRLEVEDPSNQHSTRHSKLFPQSHPLEVLRLPIRREPFNKFQTKVVEFKFGRHAMTICKIENNMRSQMPRGATLSANEGIYADETR